MTNTLNTPIEALEMKYPLRVRRYQLRRDSAGKGRHSGGEGLIREFEFLQPAQVSILSERRTQHPWGLCSGGDGAAGLNTLNGDIVAAKTTFFVEQGDVVKIATAGGGGYGAQHGNEKNI